MFKNKRRLFTFTVALLTAVALWGALLTGTAAAQSSQPTTPGQEWHYGMMGHGMMGDHMGYGYGMQAGVPVTGTAPYQGGGMGYGMMGHGMMGHGMMGHGMMGDHMGYGYGMQAGVPVTGTAPYQGGGMGYGMMGHGMMGGHMGYGYGMQAGVPVTGTAPYQGWGMMGHGCH